MLKNKRIRKFLSPTVDSYVAIEVSHNFVDVKIADCDRNITLSFYNDQANKKKMETFYNLISDAYYAFNKMHSGGK